MKHRILALGLAVVLFFCAVPAVFAVEFTPEQQLYLLQDVQEIIRQDGLESSSEDAPLERALKAVLKVVPTEEVLLEKLTADPLLYEILLDEMLSGYDAYTQYLPSGTYSAVYDPETNYVASVSPFRLTTRVRWWWRSTSPALPQRPASARATFSSLAQARALPVWM